MLFRCAEFTSTSTRLTRNFTPHQHAKRNRGSVKFLPLKSNVYKTKLRFYSTTMKNIQITIDGSPGGGKTTMAALLTVLLERCGSEVQVDDSSGERFSEVRSSLVQNPEGMAPQFKVSIQVRPTPVKKSKKVSVEDYGSLSSLGSLGSSNYNP